MTKSADNGNFFFFFFFFLCSERDAEDLDQISSWFKIHNPFDSNMTRLQSLSTSLIGDDKINCDETESLGCSIQMKLEHTIVIT